jgi:SAM-dependent methyltransferase
LSPTPISAALAFTGERFTPEHKGPIWYEHWHRYCAVAPHAAGRVVLDAACGEGYGSMLLAGSASRVVGVDLDAEAVAHARARYRAPNLAFARASVTALPFASGVFDAIVSFETIEHLAAQRAMLGEFRRVLSPQGFLVISSPNRPVYNEGGDVDNAFHVRELDRDELQALLDPGFPQQAWYAQRAIANSVLWAEQPSIDGVRFDVLTADGPARAAAPAAPMYYVVVCSAAGAALPSLPSLSLFDDGALSLWREFARALRRERLLAWDEIDARKIAEDRLAELVGATNALASERQRSAALQASADAVDAELAAVRARCSGLEAQLTHEAAAHAETRARLAFRETLPGWLRWPASAVKRRLSAGAS